MTDTNITPFLFEGEALVRVVAVNDDPWFIAKDVCKCLEIARTDSAIRGLDDDEKGTHIMSTPGGTQQVSVVNEAGLYRLIFTSRKAAAERFKRWLAHDVLPAIRKNGAYVHHQEAQIIPPDGDRRPFPDWTMDELRTRRGVVDMYRMTYGVQAAQWIVPQLGFPQPPANFIEGSRQLVIQFPDAAE